MKRRTLWKIAAATVLAAMLLPLFPVLNATRVSATEVAPLPWAMESFGQQHAQIFRTASAPTLDGTLDSLYTMMDTHNDGDSNFSGIFISTSSDGTSPATIASEFRPKLIEHYAAYDSSKIYFVVRATTRESGDEYVLNAKLGFDFAESQTASQAGTSFRFALTAGQTSASGTNYSIRQVSAGMVNDSTGEYPIVTTTYEFSLNWADVVGNVVAAEPDTAFDRLYFSTTLTFESGDGTMYWVYGVPNNAAMPDGKTIGSAFAQEFESTGSFTPNVIELCGVKSDSNYTQKPEITGATRPNKAGETGQARTFALAVSMPYEGAVTASTVSSYGVLYAQTSGIANHNLVRTAASELSVGAKTGTSTMNFTATLQTTAAQYNTFFSMRPYVVYTDGHTEYGPYYTLSPFYFDIGDAEYVASYKVLMIGNSFCYYHLDELVQIAKADRVAITAANVYESGCYMYEHWTWMLNDYSDSDVYKLYTHTPENPAGTQTAGVTLKQCLASQSDWDAISMQEHFNPDVADVYENALGGTLPYAPNLVRYLTVNHPSARILWLQTWAYQVGYGWENYTVGTTRTKSSSVDSTEQQTAEYQNIAATARYLCDNIDGLNRLPCGDAWQIARANPVIGDTLCGRYGNLTGDCYHDGDIGGGQYLNACVWYEVLTHRSCVGNTWTPTEYELSAAKITALQNAAHQAVANCYGVDWAR